MRKLSNISNNIYTLFIEIGRPYTRESNIDGSYVTQIFTSKDLEYFEKVTFPTEASLLDTHIDKYRSGLTTPKPSIFNTYQHLEIR